jgi:uncharacterized membrane protein
MSKEISMPALMPSVVFTSLPPVITVMVVLGVVLGVVVTVVYVVILVRLYRPKALDERVRTRRGVAADGSTAALGGSSTAHWGGGFGGGGFDGGFDGGGGGGDC